MCNTMFNDYNEKEDSIYNNIFNTITYNYLCI